ncbi:MAG TPA: DUF1015 domain-containing protein [Terriglobales bacterium]|nr:DUF1015 domain-containing protein [Terriglobales bacterium]
MARIQPFPALRYNLDKVHIDDVVTQPYDKITPAMRERYLTQSPYNLVRVILGEKREGDDDDENVYTRAHQFLQEWIASDVLRADPEPGIYAYTQTFRSPQSGAESQPIVRRGFIALCGLEPYANRVVFRHEQTLSGPKLDRQKLLRATRTHFGQIFMLYSDPSQNAERELFSRATKPAASTTDEYGTLHQLYRETDAAVIARLQAAMAPLPLVIADGHHRYETALLWSQEQDAEHPGSSTRPWQWVMTTCVNLDAPGLVVLPTHRLVYGLPDFTPARASQALRKLFDWEPLGETTWATLAPRLASAAGARPVFAVVLAGESALLRPKADLDLPQLLPDALPEQRKLDVLLLHQLALNLALGVTPDMVREERYLRYAHSAPEALAAVQSGAAQAAFLLNPIPPAQVRDVALAGGVMPQKSTDFFPKLLTGLALYSVGH